MLDYDTPSGFGKVHDSTNHSILINCDDQSSSLCESKTIIYEPQIKQTNYFILVNITNSEYISNNINDLQMQIGYINPKYTAFLISLRYICLGISITTASLYWFSVRRLGTWKKWIFEQKFILILGILLAIFNDPFYAITVLIPNMGR